MKTTQKTLLGLVLIFNSLPAVAQIGPDGTGIVNGAHIGPGTDLSDTDLSNADLTGADLSNAYLSDADLRGANLRGANLTNANLTDANLTDANLSDANLSDADLSDADLTGADLINANLSDADLTGADLSHARLHHAHLSGANLTGVKSGGIMGTPSALPTGWVLINGYLIGSGANLSYADLANLNLWGGGDLSNADLINANLLDANLSGTDLSGADLSGAALTNANLTDANLKDANLTGANLTNANLTDANLTDAELTDADLTNANLQGAQLNGIELTGAALSGVMLSGLDNFLLNKIGSLETEVGTHTHDGDNSGISPEQAAAIQANTAKTEEQAEALEEGSMELDNHEDRILLLESQLATLQTMVAQLSDTATIQDLEQQVADLSERPTLQQVRDARPGSVLLSVDSEAGSVALNFTVEESEDLTTWTPVEGTGVSQTLTLPEGKRFYRFAH